MAPFLRVFTFSGEVLRLVRQNPTLLNPIFFNVAFTVPVSLLLTLLGGRVQSEVMAHVVMGGGLVALYFMDYFCNGLTASLIYDQVTTGDATLGRALSRTARSAVGIFIFAAVSGLFDLLTSYVNNRRDQLARILLGVVRAVWTAAVYVVMPAMVIEELSFFAAFSRSKDLAKNDPTGVGVGIIALSLVNWVLGVVCMAIAYKGAPFVAKLHPLAGGIFFYTFFNMYWALAGFVKIAYFSCFYLWASACEREGRADPALAPAPLAQAMAA